MVRILIFLTAFSSCSLLSFSQNNVNDTMTLEIINALESWPTYKGGVSKLNKFIVNSINYPKEAIRDSLEGIVYISMEVDTEGSTINHIILKSVRDDLDKEAIRIAELIRFDKPALQNGKPVVVRYTIPIEFRLSEKDELKRKGCKK